MRQLSDDEIAKIGSETGLRHLPDYLDSDRWNNIECALFVFARKCIAASQQADQADVVKPCDCPNDYDSVYVCQDCGYIWHI